MLNRFRKKQSDPYEGMAHTQIDSFDWFMYFASMESVTPQHRCFFVLIDTAIETENRFDVNVDVMGTNTSHQQKAFVSKTDRFFFNEPR